MKDMSRSSGNSERTRKNDSLLLFLFTVHVFSNGWNLIMNNPTKEFVDQICGIYGDHYDDREEDSRPGGANWRPGVRAAHRSISSFQRDLQEVHGISLSRSRIFPVLLCSFLFS